MIRPSLRLECLYNCCTLDWQYLLMVEVACPRVPGIPFIVSEPSYSFDNCMAHRGGRVQTCASSESCRPHGLEGQGIGANRPRASSRWSRAAGLIQHSIHLCCGRSMEPKHEVGSVPKWDLASSRCLRLIYCTVLALTSRALISCWCKPDRLLPDCSNAPTLQRSSAHDSDSRPVSA
jgi:hypothetical protein